MRTGRGTGQALILLGLLIAATLLFDVRGAADLIRPDSSTFNLGDGSAAQPPPIETKSRFPFAQMGKDYFKRGITRLNETTAFNQDSIEIVIGVDDRQPDSAARIADLIAKENGETLNTISIKGKTRAFVLRVPLEKGSSLLREIETSDLSSYIEPRTRFRTSLIPNDAEWPQQWGLSRIQADYAWNITTGKPFVVIAVVDTGVDWDHPDLAGNIWNNTDEWLDGKDNDGNSFVDDVRGWDFVDTVDIVAPGEDGTVRDNDPMDFHGHGTHCAGIAAAVGNNSLGIAGAAWNSKIMPVRAGYTAADGNGYLENDDAAQAIIYAVENGADIISMSWGAYETSELIQEAVKYAYDSGVLLIAAAGNDVTSLRLYPAAYDEVIAVSATQQDDKPTWWTNFGDWITLAAPGVDIYSTVFDDSYATMDGTSMSTPLVAGVAALIWSRFPRMTRDQVQAQLQFTADDKGDPGFDAHYGYGRVNAYKAVLSNPPQHDLLVLKLKASPIVKPGDTAVIDTIVLNMGTSQEDNVITQLVVNGSVVNSTLINTLPSGASASIRFLWNSTNAAGVYNVVCYIVPATGEVDTRNNALSTSIWVRAPQVLRVPDGYPTIQGAVDAAVEGDTVSVAAGTYNEHVLISKKDLKLVGEETDTTIIDGGRESDVILVAADNVEIREFTLRGSSRDQTYQPPFSGILVFRSKNIIVTETNTFDNLVGIFIYRSTRTMLRLNRMNGNRYNFGIDGLVLDEFIQDVDESNTVDGKPISYWVNEHNKVAPPNSGCVVAVNSTNIVAKTLSLTKNYAGVLYAFTVNSVVENVSMSNNYMGVQIFHSSVNAVVKSSLVRNEVGIYLQDSQDNYVSHSAVASGSYGLRVYNSTRNKINFNEITSNRRGVFIHESDKNTVLGNKIRKNAVGIWLYRSDDNIVENDEVSYSVSGILLTQSEHNTVCRNDVIDNFFAMGTYCYGIWIEWSSHNTIYLNNFINNQFHVFSVESVNTWDMGYPTGGNHWSGYRGVDTDNDGIGDTPQSIDENNQDNYPFVNALTHPEVEMIHDAAVISVAPSASEVYIGYALRIVVVISNEGNVTEAFPVTAQYELQETNNIIETQIAQALAPGANVTLVFIWTTAEPGVHTVRAVVPALENETDTNDNDKASSVSVKVKILGDVDNNDLVDIRDVARAAVAFGTYPNHPRWNVQADVNQDNRIDIRDLALIAKNFGQEYP